MKTRIKKSDPGFETVFDLSNRLAMLLNPDRWFNLVGSDEIPDVEYNAAVSDVENKLSEALEEHRVIEALKTVQYPVESVEICEN